MNAEAEVRSTLVQEEHAPADPVPVEPSPVAAFEETATLTLPGTGSGGTIHLRFSTYDGPMDLLLDLVRENKFDILTLPVGAIADAYLARIREIQDHDLAVAADFLLMAANLLYLKSRVLLPPPPAPEGADEELPEDDGFFFSTPEEMQARLLALQALKAVARDLREREGAARLVHFRNAPGPNPSLPAGGGQVDALVTAFRKLLRSMPVTEQRTIAADRKSVPDKIRAILRALRSSRATASGEATFAALLEAPIDRHEIVVTFLALLELVRTGAVRVGQEDLFGNLTVFALEAAPSAENPLEGVRIAS